jgi:hypothetical protein
MQVQVYKYRATRTPANKTVDAWQSIGEWHLKGKECIGTSYQSSSNATPTQLRLSSTTQEGAEQSARSRGAQQIPHQPAPHRNAYQPRGSIH